MNLTAIRAAIAAAVGAATGLAVSTTVPDNVTPPQAVVVPDPGTYLTFIYNSSTPNLASFIIILVTSRADAPTGQTKLDDLLTGNLWAAFDADSTLGGLCQYCQFTEVRNVGPVVWGSTPFYGASPVVEVQG